MHWKPFITATFDHNAPVERLVGPRGLPAPVRLPRALCIIIPCHRLVGKKGTLTGYAGGHECKRLLPDPEEPAHALSERLF